MFRVTELNEIVAGFIDNMLDEEIDESLNFFEEVAKHFGLKSYDHVAVVTSEEVDYMLTEEYLPEEALSLHPFFEKRNGNRYLYFKNAEDADKAVEMIEKEIARLENEL